MYHYAGNNPVKYTDPDGREDSFSQEEKNFITESQNKAISNLDLLIFKLKKYSGTDKNELHKNAFDYLGFDIMLSDDKEKLIKSLGLIRDNLKTMTIDDYARSDNPFKSYVIRLEKIYPSGTRTVEYLKTIYLSGLATSKLLESGCSSPLHGQLVHETAHKALDARNIKYATETNLVTGILQENKRYNADSWSTFYLEMVGR